MSACTSYDTNPNWWNTLWCRVESYVPGKTRGDYLTNPDAFPKANLAPVAPQTYDQMTNFGSWTSDKAVELTGQNLASALQAAIATLPDSKPPEDNGSGSNLWLWVLGGIAGGVFLLGNAARRYYR